jgi:biofilm PGA synthesis N-glycosyltransferase PgaC
LETIVAICIILVLYAYIGYPVLIGLAAYIGKWIRANNKHEQDHTPSVTLIIPAYNEASCIRKKIQNSLALTYPATKLQLVVVADGSLDDTVSIVSEFSQVTLLHEAERKGKAAAIHRAMQQVRSELVVFTDANAILNPEALSKIVPHFADPGVGAVAGEKRVAVSVPPATAGEGWYWYYESILKKYESDFHSVMGAAGELFGMRTALYEPVAADTIVDDLVISLQVSLKAYRIRYEPAAFAVELASMSTREELERKTRIAAGGIQSLQRYGFKLLISKPLLAFEYFSHRVLRWLLVPYLLVLLFIFGIIGLFINETKGWMFWFFTAQLLFYLVALLGGILDRKKQKAGWIYAPFYFCVLHYAMIAGLIRYYSGKQSVLWKKASR